MGLAIFLVYLVMASQFESFLHPFVIIFTLPLGAIGVILALAVTGHTINVVAIIGAVMLAGIVVNNAIVLIDAVNQRRRAGAPVDEALTDAGLARLRPILMTSATTIFGLLPMALGLGEGAELRAPLAVTVIGGLAVATALTLIVIPVVYSLLAGERIGQTAEAPDEAAGGPMRLMQVAVERARSLPSTGREEREATMNLPTLAVRRPITTAMILVSVLLVGGIAFYRLPLAFLPTLDAPFIFVQIPYPNSHPRQIEKEITKPVEEILSTLSGVKKLNSTTDADGAQFFMEFTWGQEIDVIRMKVSEKMDQVEPTLPAGHRPDPDLLLQHQRHPGGPGAHRRRGRRSVAELRAARGAHPQPAAAGQRRRPGRPQRGRAPRALRRPHPRQDQGARGRRRRRWRSCSRAFPRTSCSAAPSPAGCATPSAPWVPSNPSSPSPTWSSTSAACASATSPRSPTRSRRSTFGRHLDGKYAVALDVYKESTANTVEVVREVTRVVEEDINNDPLLKGIQLWVWEDQAEEITSGIDGLKKAGLTGALLATLSLYFFLRRIDSTVIVAMSIPFSIIATCGVMYFMGSSLNILSMMGLMLAVGMLVDNAIVVLESIDRRMREEGDRTQGRPRGRRPGADGGHRLHRHHPDRLPAAGCRRRHRAHHLAQGGGDHHLHRPGVLAVLLADPDPADVGPPAQGRGTTAATGSSSGSRSAMSGSSAGPSNTASRPSVCWWSVWWSASCPSSPAGSTRRSSRAPSTRGSTSTTSSTTSLQDPSRRRWSSRSRPISRPTPRSSWSRPSTPTTPRTRPGPPSA